MQEDPDNIETYLNRFVDLQLEVQSKSCPLLTKLRDKMNRKDRADGFRRHHAL